MSRAQYIITHNHRTRAPHPISRRLILTERQRATPSSDAITHYIYTHIFVQLPSLIHCKQAAICISPCVPLSLENIILVN